MTNQPAAEAIHGLACPRCGAADRLGVHRRHRDPVLDYQCGHCGRVFNAAHEAEAVLGSSDALVRQLVAGDTSGPIQLADV